MKALILLIVMTFAFSINLRSQVVLVRADSSCTTTCGLAGDERENTELVHLQIRNDSIQQIKDLGEIKRIPLRVAIVQEDSQTVEIKEIVIQRAIDNLNKSFKATNFVFYLARTEIIISTLKLEELSDNLYEKYNAFSDKYDDKDLLSIYIFDHKDDFCVVSPTTVSCGRTGGFSYILSDRTSNIVMSRFDITDIKVVSHEMGHFWGLYHTFEETAFGKDDFSKDKCKVLGDRICDTPPDPGPIFEVYINYVACEYQYLKNDAGIPYKPQVENYMSYYKPCYLKDFKFTPGQVAVMKAAAKQPFRERFFK